MELEYVVLTPDDLADAADLLAKHFYPQENLVRKPSSIHQVMGCSHFTAYTLCKEITTVNEKNDKHDKDD